MTPGVRKGLLVAALHVALVGSLGAKLLVDRSSYPRAWARTGPVDPDLPIRGRYVSLRLEARLGDGLAMSLPAEMPGLELPATRARLVSVQGSMVAMPSEDSDSVFVRARGRNDGPVAEVITPVAFFIPENVADPSIRQAGEELWVEVTLPRSGPPRPIRLAVKKDGVLTPLDLD